VSLGTSLFEAVKAFHKKCELPVGDPYNPDVTRNWDLRMALIQEEFDELKEAKGDPIESADALADLAYVIFGAAVDWGVPLPDMLSEVHRSNMTKEPIHNEAGKVVKGPYYRAPDLKRVWNWWGVCLNDYPL
jgi:hypothetical protein